MIQHKFRIEEAVLKLPKFGEQCYITKTSYPVNYKNNIYCSIKREFSMAVYSEDDKSHMRLVKINVSNTHLIFSEGSFAMQDILTRVAKIYSKLILNISYKGGIIAINNLPELLEKWKLVRTYINEKYRGNQVNRFIAKTNLTMSSESAIIKELSLYKNFGVLLKPIYYKYDSDKYQVIQQNIPTKSGIMRLDEQFLLHDIYKNETINLKVEAHHLKSNIYLKMEGNYKFKKALENWLLEAVISLIENFEGKEYYSRTNIILKP